MAITRITAQWLGFRGAPGYSNFFFDGAPVVDEEVEAQALAVRTFLNEAATYMPSDVTINIQPTASVIDEASGQITGEIDFAAPPSVTGQTAGGYSAASGAVVNWNTSSFSNGRRVRGRTFLVPLSSDAYDANGDLSTGTLSILRTAATELVNDPGPTPLVVWSRPVGGAGGSVSPVTSSSVPDLGAILRSRRD